MTGDPSVRPDDEPTPDERFPGMGLSAEQRRMVRFLMIIAAVAVAWAVLAIVIVVS